MTLYDILQSRDLSRVYIKYRDGISNLKQSLKIRKAKMGYELYEFCFEDLYTKNLLLEFEATEEELKSIQIKDDGSVDILDHHVMFFIK